MKHDLPDAYIESKRFRLGRWLSKVLTHSLVLGLSAALAAGGYGLTQVGCRNDAITYAHALAPDLSCNAVRTCWVMCGHDVADIAICRRGKDIWQCTAGGGYNDKPGCELVK